MQVTMNERSTTCGLNKDNCTIGGNSFFFRKLLFLTLKSSNSKLYHTTALKFSAKQINLVTKKSVSVICEIININMDFRIFVNASPKSQAQFCWGCSSQTCLFDHLYRMTTRLRWQDNKCWVCPRQFPYNCYCIRWPPV